MNEILNSLWTLVSDLAVNGWGLVSTVGGWSYDLLAEFHTAAPRLEGLLIGVLLTWVLLRRDMHPLLRVVSAPLKLVVDILDLAWDQVTEVVGDLLRTVQGWARGVWQWCWGKASGALGWVKGKVKNTYGRILSLLTRLRDVLRKKGE
jgi:hypothetical protein